MIGIKIHKPNTSFMEKVISEMHAEMILSILEQKGFGKEEILQVLEEIKKRREHD